ncbi:hypothetical protein [Paraburkholderia sacchari]|uniref:Uncharacterized protein n=1 Tax=Paraburkholderia sacchari TaxID=159450 RepID=A0A8T6ZAR5_9BURK|nr:hypothetical protein [Paraburkholderia sacchari]NLP62237.1 hypothetical protein [Paraburkholderia sacchari]
MGDWDGLNPLCTNPMPIINIHLNPVGHSGNAHLVRPRARSQQHLMHTGQVFGATDALEYGATIGATINAFFFQKEVAMQENPVGSTILPVA